MELSARPRRRIATATDQSRLQSRPMSTVLDDPQARLRRGVYALLIALSAGAMLGRMMAVDAVDRRAVQEYRIQKASGGEAGGVRAAWAQGRRPGRGIGSRRGAAARASSACERPFLSANDRSRWCTLRALVEDDMRVEGAPYAIDKVINEPGWDTIDMVKHDGHLYSSKPPLVPTLLAAEYWVIHRADRRHARDAPLRHRPVHARDDQRDSAGHRDVPAWRGSPSGWARPTGGGS